MQDTYQVTIVKYGTRMGRKGEIYLNWDVYGKPDEPLGMDYFFWVIRNGERTVVVDTGFSPEGGARRRRSFVIDPEDALAALGIDPATAPQVLVTHAHYDHIGNLHLFTAAEVVMASAEYDFWTSPMSQRAQFQHSSETREIDALRTIRDGGRLRTFDDEIDIAPGIRMQRVGGHTPGQSIVLVDTVEGTVVLASDAIHYYEELDDDVPFAFVADLPSMYRGFDLLHELVASGVVRHVVPGHDPLTIGRFAPVAAGPLAGIAATIG